MSKAQEFVSKAASQIGTKESPANSNKCKYGEWYGMNGQPWCEMFLSWCANEVGMLNTCGKFAWTIGHSDWFKKYNQWIKRGESVNVGDYVYFANKGKICHVGVVEKVISSTCVQTIEGNTSTGNNANGGQVQRRTRNYGTEGSSWYVAGFGRPKWVDNTNSQTVSQSQNVVDKTPIKVVQNWLNTNYTSGLVVDGSYGSKTKAALVKALQIELNKTGAKLVVDGVCGAYTLKASPLIKKGSKGSIVKILQAALMCKGFNTGGLDGDAGSKTDAAIRAYQKSRGLVVDGECFIKTWCALLS